MRDIREHAIHERDEVSIGILVGWLLAVGDWRWEGQQGVGEEEGWLDYCQRQGVSSDIEDELKIDLMRSFELDERSFDKAIKKGWKAIEEVGREIERDLWRSAIKTRCVQPTRRDSGLLRKGLHADPLPFFSQVDRLAPHCSTKAYLRTYQLNTIVQISGRKLANARRR